MGKIEIDEKILYEVLVKYIGSKFDTKLILTDKRIIFERKKGLFNKQYKIVDEINISDIRLNKNKLLIKNTGSTVVIEANTKIYKFVCGSVIEAKLIIEEIIKIKTGENLLERTSGKVVKMSNVISKTVGAVTGAVASVGLVVVTINKNKKTIMKAVKTVKNMLKR